MRLRHHEQAEEPLPPEDPAWGAEALRLAQFEILPTGAIEEAVLRHVPRDVALTVTASPAKGLAATLGLTERLSRHGYRVTPHLAARMVRGRGELESIVSRLVGSGVTSVFCPAGDAETPAGDYAGALPLLRDLAAMGRPFAEVGITGFPEPHPLIDDAGLMTAILDKRPFATYVVTNMCFDPRVIADWVERIRAAGVSLPVVVGLPGPVERARLLATAARIGVGESIRFMSGHVGAVARIATPGGFSSDRFLRRASGLFAQQSLGVRGLHVFTFNQVARAVQWREQVLSDSD